MRPGRRPLLVPIVAILSLPPVAACGSTEGDGTPLEPAAVTTTSTGARAAGTTIATSTASTIEATTPTDTAVPSTELSRIDEAAISTIPAERIDNEVYINWIGGSHVEIDDRSVPAAVRERLPRIGARPLELIADVRTAPLPADIEQRVVRAAAQGADGLIVPLNVSWVRWDGNADCDDVTPAYAFYACILAPPADEVASRLLADVESLVTAIVETELPAYVYIIPHSEQSLDDPLIGELVAGAEAAIATLDPQLDRVAFGTEVANRGLANMRESVEFFDMVHPTVAGTRSLADWFAPEFERFFVDQLG